MSRKMSPSRPNNVSVSVSSRTETQTSRSRLGLGPQGLVYIPGPTDLYDNDASDTATLHQYLRQYTYIDYSADDWLDKLLYALPLRGLLQHNENHNGDDIELL